MGCSLPGVPGWAVLRGNLDRFPADVFADDSVAVQLPRIRSALADTFPDLLTTVTPDAVQEQLGRHGEDAWCEQRWIADYEH